MKSTEDLYLDEVRLKRIQTLKGVWDMLTSHGGLDSQRLRLSPWLLNEVIEHYIGNLIILKRRYKIEQRIQLYRIAGLTTYAVVRYRPVIPLVDVLESAKELYANETLAVIHGVAVCGEFTSNDKVMTILAEDWFQVWYNDFLYMLHYRNYTPEDLIFTYETLSLTKFSDCFKKSED